MSDHTASTLSDEIRQRLIAAASEARAHAYVPYSNYPVGAALLTASGAVISGCNVENASFGATICGERTATVKAVSQGEREFQAIAVVTSNGASPCGICRQVLYEFAPEMTVILADAQGKVSWEGPLTDLLMLGFGPKKLAEGQPEAARD